MRWLPGGSRRQRGTNGLVPSVRHGVGFLVASLAMLTACSGDPSARADARAAPASEAVPVSVATAVTKSVPVQVLANGTVQAMATVTINSQVDGQISAIHFTEGQDVKQGDLLFTLDRRPFEATLRQAQANLRRDTAQAQQADAAVAQARAAERQAQANLTRDTAQLANANAEVRRYKSLIDDGAISQEQYEQIRTAALAMEATVEADRAAITNATAVIGAAQAAVENAQAAIQADQAVVENAGIQLGYTTIDAPMPGRTGSLLAHVGSAVKARDAASPLVVINQIHPTYVAFSVPEQYLAEIRKYRAIGSLQAHALIPGQETTPARGELGFINNTVDPATGTIQLKATFPNTDDRLWPGQFVNVALTLVTVPNAVVVPTQAIQTGQHGPYVFVVQADHTVQSRSVMPGRVLDTETIVETGVAVGDRVVTEGQVRLVPGAKVAINSSAASAAPQGTAE
jgi:membrane fusion protein, multidrug efflux system